MKIVAEVEKTDSLEFRVCFALETTKLLSQGDMLIQLKLEQRTALRANVD